MNKIHVIYIPGLGDNNVEIQRRSILTWRWWGVQPELYRMNWQDDVRWQVKFDKLLKRIDEIRSDNKLVALVGASAGASAAINAYAARKDKIAGVVCIAGKINNADDIGEKYRRNNPSFIESAYECEKSLANLTDADRKHILCRYALIDELIRRQDSQIKGAKNQLSPTIGHVITIGFQLALGGPSIIRFLKQ